MKVLNGSSTGIRILILIRSTTLAFSSFWSERIELDDSPGSAAL